MAALVQAGSHPNLVMPHRFQRDESSDERYYLVLEWAGDQTLAGRLAEAEAAMGEAVRLQPDYQLAQHNLVGLQGEGQPSCRR